MILSIRIIIFIALSMTVLTGCSKLAEPEGKPAIVTSFYPMQYIAERIAGDDATVEALVPAGVEPHDWEPSPNDIVSIQNARVFVYLGILESWADQVVADLDTGRTIVIRAIDGQQL